MTAVVSTRRSFAFLLLLALLGAACRAEPAVEQRSGSLEPAPSATIVPTPEPANAGSVSPTDTESDAGENPPEPDVADLAVEPPAAAAIPASWDDPIPLDAAVAEGTLPNGMTYLVRSNDRPGSQAQLRLVVRAGSVHEAPGTHGAAHFLEHMMFNGTERFPGNEIVQVLESFGSGFGPDVNAYTSYEETVYELEVPARSTDTVQLGLDVLHQWATAATIDPAAVVAERGVVREELRRAVEPVSGRVGREVRNVLFSGSDYLGAEPIGTADVVEAMTDVELREFYERWYQPQNMTVIAVGDISVADTVRRIENTFTQPAPSEATVRPQLQLAPGALSEPVFQVFTDPEIQRPEVEVLWRLGNQPVTTRAGLRNEIVANVSIAMLNSRLFEQLQEGNLVFLGAQATTGQFTSQMRVATVSARTEAASIDTAFEQLLAEVEQARQYGFTQQELDRQLSQLRTLVEQQFAESGTRQDATLAQELVQYALGREVSPAPNEQLDIANEVIDSINVEDAQRFLFDVLATEPFVFVTAPQDDLAVLPTEAELRDGYLGVVGLPVEERERVESEITELMARPEPAAITDRSTLDGLRATIVTYENGARLVYRETAITENSVVLQASSVGGYFATDGPEVPLLDSVPGLVAGSGFASVDIVTLDRLLADSIASVDTSVGRAEEGLSGSAATADLETLFQLVHLHMTEPAITDLQVRQFLERWRPLAENPATNPSVAGNLELWQLRYGTSPWFRLIPTAEDLDAFDQDLLLDAYRARFADAGDFVFAVVGDFDAEVLEDIGARYLGTLPDSGRREVPIDRDPGLPEQNLLGVVEAGVGDQGRVRINWESPYPFTLEADVAAQALELVVDARLRDLIREELGASYAPNAAVSVLSEPKPWVDTIIEVESDPDRLEEVSDVIRAELDRIRAGDIDQVYLDRAIDQLTEGYRFFTNNQWLGLMLFHTRYPDRPSGEYRDRTVVAEQLTIDDLAATAAVVFPPTRSVEVWLLPADG